MNSLAMDLGLCEPFLLPVRFNQLAKVPPRAQPHVPPISPTVETDLRLFLFLFSLQGYELKYDIDQWRIQNYRKHFIPF